MGGSYLINMKAGKLCGSLTFPFIEYYPFPICLALKLKNTWPKICSAIIRPKPNMHSRALELIAPRISCQHFTSGTLAALTPRLIPCFYKTIHS